MDKLFYYSYDGSDDYSIMVCAIDVAEAVFFIKRDFRKKLFYYYRFERDCDIINAVERTEDLEISEIDNELDIPATLVHSVPYGRTIYDVHGFYMSCKGIIERGGAWTNPKTIQNEAPSKLEIKIADQADRLNEVIQKRGVDYLFLYSLIANGLDEEVVECWKSKYFQEYIDKGDFNVTKVKDGEVTDITIYIDNKQKKMWMLFDYSLDDNINRKLCHRLSCSVDCSYFESVQRKFADLGCQTEIKFAEYPDVPKTRCLAIAGVNLTYANCRYTFRTDR